ncbi:MAG: methylated-DNA--protein-cysteine methyltransferase [Pseudomonadota bacterium]
MTPEVLYVDRLESPLGDCFLVFDAGLRVRALEWADFEARMHRLLARHWGPEGRGHRLAPATAPAPLREALHHYFGNRGTSLGEIATRTAGTAFQESVWATLRGIPPGRTVSYGQLATAIGRPAAVRAVGLAVGANPVSLVIPCHRVIGSDGSLTGYAGGLYRKRWLLAHEGAATGIPQIRSTEGPLPPSMAPPT